VHTADLSASIYPSIMARYLADNGDERINADIIPSIGLADKSAMAAVNRALLLFVYSYFVHPSQQGCCKVRPGDRKGRHYDNVASHRPAFSGIS